MNAQEQNQIKKPSPGPFFPTLSSLLSLSERVAAFGTRSEVVLVVFIEHVELFTCGGSGDGQKVIHGSNSSRKHWRERRAGRGGWVGVVGVLLGSRCLLGHLYARVS